MEIEFDPEKEAQNRRKHGVSLRLGLVVLNRALGEDLDAGEAAEDRWITYGLVGTALYVCVHTRRGTRHRIISVRKATRAEEEAWLAR